MAISTTIIEQYQRRYSEGRQEGEHNMKYIATRSANKPLHVSQAAVRSFSIHLPRNGLLLNRGVLPAVRQRLNHVNGGVRPLLLSNT